MDDTEFEYRGHWIHIELEEVGSDKWRASYSVAGQNPMDVAGRPVKRAAVLGDARRNARNLVDRLIQREATGGEIVVLVGTSFYSFPTAEEAVEGRAWVSWVEHDEDAFSARFPNSQRVSFIGGSCGLSG